MRQEHIGMGKGETSDITRGVRAEARSSNVGQAGRRPQAARLELPPSVDVERIGGRVLRMRRDVQQSAAARQLALRSRRGVVLSARVGTSPPPARVPQRWMSGVLVAGCSACVGTCSRAPPPVSLPCDPAVKCCPQASGRRRRPLELLAGCSARGSRTWCCLHASGRAAERRRPSACLAIPPWSVVRKRRDVAAARLSSRRVLMSNVLVAGCSACVGTCSRAPPPVSLPCDPAVECCPQASGRRRRPLELPPSVDVERVGGRVLRMRRDVQQSAAARCSACVGTCSRAPPPVSLPCDPAVECCPQASGRRRRPLELPPSVDVERVGGRVLRMRRDGAPHASGRAAERRRPSACLAIPPWSVVRKRRDVAAARLSSRRGWMSGVLVAGCSACVGTCSRAPPPVSLPCDPAVECCPQASGRRRRPLELPPSVDVERVGGRVLRMRRDVQQSAAARCSACVGTCSRAPPPVSLPCDPAVECCPQASGRRRRPLELPPSVDVERVGGRVLRMRRDVQQSAAARCSACVGTCSRAPPPVSLPCDPAVECCPQASGRRRRPLELPPRMDVGRVGGRVLRMRRDVQQSAAARQLALRSRRGVLSASVGTSPPPAGVAGRVLRTRKPDVVLSARVGTCSSTPPPAWDPAERRRVDRERQRLAQRGGQREPTIIVRKDRRNVHVATADKAYASQSVKSSSGTAATSFPSSSPVLALCMPFAWLSPVSGRWLQQPSTAAPSDPVLERQLAATTSPPHRPTFRAWQHSAEFLPWEARPRGRPARPASPHLVAPSPHVRHLRLLAISHDQHAPASPRPSSYGKTLRIECACASSQQFPLPASDSGTHKCAYRGSHITSIFLSPIGSTDMSSTDTNMTSQRTPSYIRMLNNSLVFGFPGLDPRVARVHMTILNGSGGRWLLVEFLGWNAAAAEMPFPSLCVNGDDRMLVFQMPPDFTFTYCNGTRACRWSVQDCNFSLVISERDDYSYLRGVVVGHDETHDLSEATTHSAAAIMPQLTLGYMVVVLNEIAAAMRNLASTVRGVGRDGPEARFTNFNALGIAPSPAEVHILRRLYNPVKPTLTALGSLTTASAKFVRYREIAVHERVRISNNDGSSKIYGKRGTCRHSYVESTGNLRDEAFYMSIYQDADTGKWYPAGQTPDAGCRRERDMVLKERQPMKGAESGPAAIDELAHDSNEVPFPLAGQAGSSISPVDGVSANTPSTHSSRTCKHTHQELVDCVQVLDGSISCDTCGTMEAATAGDTAVTVL
ncbi:hypothetical protein C8T65DRAFT_693755 [Cerioporus squamosus]|nr:hypothetical protein C8T65DRAFT_693755 [Cerioporus squamosus]